MGIQDVEVFIRSTKTGEVTEKKRVLRNVTQGERLEVWVNDVLVHEHEWTRPMDDDDPEYGVVKW